MRGLPLLEMPSNLWKSCAGWELNLVSSKFCFILRICACGNHIRRTSKMGLRDQGCFNPQLSFKLLLSGPWRGTLALQLRHSFDYDFYLCLYSSSQFYNFLCILLLWSFKNNWRPYHTCSLEKHSQGAFEKAERGVKTMDGIWFVAEGKAGQIIPSSLEFYLMIYKECKLGDNHRRYT